MPNIFSEPKELKKWAIALANACGGQEVSQSSIKLNKHNVAKVDSLLEQFAVDYNFHMQIMNEVRAEQDKEVNMPGQDMDIEMEQGKKEEE